MATGINPVQLALRDLGQGFGNILSDEAKRRQDALLAQQQQGQLSLAQAQLRNQAEVAAAEGQVSLAKVGAEGRQFDVTTGLKQQELTQSGEHQRGQLRVANRQVDATISGQDETVRHNKTSEGMMAPYYSSLGRSSDATARQQELKNDVEGERIPVEDVGKGMRAQLAAQGLSPDEIEQHMAWGLHTLDNASSAAHAPIDEKTGKPYWTRGQVNARLAAAVELRKLVGKETLTAKEVAEYRLKYLNETKDDPVLATLPYTDRGAIADAQLLHNQAFYVKTQSLLPPKIEAFRAETIAKFEKNKTGMFGAYKATPEDINILEKTVISPQVARWRVEVAQQVLAEGGGKRVVEAPPSPATKGLPPPSAKPSASGAASSAWGGYPGHGAPVVSIMHQAAVDGAIKRGLDPATVMAQIQRESGFNPAAVGKNGEIGLGQFTTSTATSRKLDLNRLRNDWQYNLNASLDYMVDLKKQHGARGVEAYNGLGAGAGDKNYVQNVQNWLPQSQQTVAALLGRASPPPAVAAEPVVPTGQSRSAPPISTGARPTQDFRAAAGNLPLQRASSPLDPLTAPLGAIPGWVEQARGLPAAIGNRILQRRTQTPVPAPPLPQGPSAGGVPQAPQAAGPSSPGLAYAAQPSLATTPPVNAPASPNAVQASTLSPWFQKTILFAVVDQLGGKNPPPDGVYRIQLAGKNLTAHIQGGQLAAVSPPS